MKTGYKIIIGILALIIIIAAGSAYYYIHAIKSVSVKDFRITSLSNMTQEGFIIDGRIILHNPSLINIRIYESKVQFFKKDNNALLATGMIKENVLKPESDTQMDFSGEVKFSNTLDLALDVMGKNETIVVAKGNILVSKSMDVSVPFSVEFDINRQLKDYADSKINRLLDYFGLSV